MTKILVVEDSPTQSEELRLILEARGFTVETSPDGEQALERLARSAFDLIISDIMMPGISGYELCRRVKSDPATRDVPVVLLTTLSDPLDIIQGLECGADNFVTKPYDPGYLVGRLKGVLENRRLRAEGRIKVGVEILFLGRKFTITSDKEQILDLLMATFEDIVRTNRELQASEEALRESERRTRLIIDTAYEAFIAMDVEGRIVEWNAEAERIFGWLRQEALGRLLVDTVIPERYRTAHIAGLEHYRATGEGPLLGRRVEIEAVRRDGSEFPLELTISPTRIGDTAIFTAFLRDITERRRAEEALRAAKSEAEEAREVAERASRAKSEFLSRMSHELRTPLNAVLGFAQLLEIDDLGPDHGESVEQILRAGRHLLQLIDEVLDVARIEEGRLSLSIEPVHLDEVVGEALDLVRPSAAPADIRMWTESSHFDRHVLADRQRLKQVLMNLLSNAVKYNRQGGTVTVSCAPTPEGRLRIGVADTGPGIPPEVRDRLFLPFERLGAEQTAVEGTGIGLSISKRLVELMGGEIGAASEIGRGSTFWVTLDPGKPQRSATCERILARRPTVRLVAAMQGGLPSNWLASTGPTSSSSTCTSPTSTATRCSGGCRSTPRPTPSPWSRSARRLRRPRSSPSSPPAPAPT
jgi:PAS domain S-box-containing protein